VILVLIIILGQRSSTFSKDTLIIFITHNFKPEFKKLLSRTRSNQTTDVVILFDDSSTQWEETDFNVVREKKPETPPVYDSVAKGHELYINYFNNNDISQYKYVWVAENDVFYPGSLHEITDFHSHIECDLLVPHYKDEDPDWKWFKTLDGFKEVHSKCILGFIMRFSNRLATKLNENKHRGFFEAFLPNYCIEQNFTICELIRSTMGYMDAVPNEITTNIEQNPYIAEKKMYHPVKV